MLFIIPQDNYETYKGIRHDDIIAKIQCFGQLSFIIQYKLSKVRQKGFFIHETSDMDIITKFYSFPEPLGSSVY